MATEQTTLDMDRLGELLERGERPQLRMLLNEQHAADLAEMFRELDLPQRVRCFRLLDLDNASAVLAEMPAEGQRLLLRELGDIGVAPIISKMSPDDAADLLSDMPKDKAASIINQMGDAEAIGDLYELMSFKDDTAGGIMSTDYVSVHATSTVEQALTDLRESYEEFDEHVYDIFVVDAQEKLVGYLSVKVLLTAPADATVESLMDTSVIAVSTDTDQEEAAEKLSKYDLLSLPVVDKMGALRGVITADDAIDVLEEEATEDIYQASGIDAGSAENAEELASSVRMAFRARLPWLLATLLIECGSAAVITKFDAVIQQTVVAASFMPMLTSVTGSVAMQSTCIVLRNTRQYNWRAAARNIWHEIRVGMLLGLACGLLTSCISLIFQQHGHLGVVVGVSLFVTMSLGVLIGTLIPIIFDRLGIEPAHASGPLITSLLDVCTMTIYLSIVYTFLEHLK
ncbi:MAG TPA: magnesium transporter [Candidatus Obscuribacterales bacterium]